jgi:hypothetical protein
MSAFSSVRARFGSLSPVANATTGAIRTCDRTCASCAWSTGQQPLCESPSERTCRIRSGSSSFSVLRRRHRLETYHTATPYRHDRQLSTMGSNRRLAALFMQATKRAGSSTVKPLRTATSCSCLISAWKLVRFDSRLLYKGKRSDLRSASCGTRFVHRRQPYNTQHPRAVLIWRQATATHNYTAPMAGPLGANRFEDSACRGLWTHAGPPVPYLTA